MGTLVVGTGWGDEGKGKIVLYLVLAGKCYMVVRFNGGNNAGHKFIYRGTVWNFHLVPSAAVIEHIICVIASGVMIDPDGLVAEMTGLKALGLSLENLLISESANLVMPWHREEEAIREAFSKNGGSIGTTRRGMGPCAADKAHRKMAVRMNDLYVPGLKHHLAEIAEIKNAMLEGMAKKAGVKFRPWKGRRLNELYHRLERFAGQVEKHVTDTSPRIIQALNDNQEVLFEGANGIGLDIDHGTFPYVTPSHPAHDAAGGSGVPLQSFGRVIGVVKAYSTRVGHGPFPTKQDNDTGKFLREKGHEFGSTTGRPRDCGWLDLFQTRNSVRKAGVTELAITLLDVLSGLPEVKLCVGYRYQGVELTDFPTHCSVLEQVEPIYVTMKGWGDVLGCRRWRDLPDTAEAYINYVETFLGKRAMLVSVGPGKEQVVV